MCSNSHALKRTPCPHRSVTAEISRPQWPQSDCHAARHRHPCLHPILFSPKETLYGPSMMSSPFCYGSYSNQSMCGECQPFSCWPVSSPICCWNGALQQPSSETGLAASLFRWSSSGRSCCLSFQPCGVTTGQPSLFSPMSRPTNRTQSPPYRSITYGSCITCSSSTQPCSVVATLPPGLPLDHSDDLWPG